MKFNKTYFFIIVSSIALCIVLIIQINWILDTAKIKEEIFNEKANLVLTKAGEAMSIDSTSRKSHEILAAEDERQKIDSLFRHYMNIYNIHIDYYYEIKALAVPVYYETPETKYGIPSQKGSYQTCISTTDNKTLELKLIFPEKRQFILAEIGTPFITSVVLILIVLILSWKTMLSLAREKIIAEHTTDFVNNMTHEFKTPLANIALAGKMITKEPNINQSEKVKHYSGIILQENEKLSHQVDLVLSMTALEREEIYLQKSELDMHQVIQDSTRQIEIQLENRNGNLTMNLQAGNFNVAGDRIHLTNAICNLIENGIKYSPENPKLSIRTFNRENNLVVEISDKGIGIDKQDQKKVFEKFYRVSTGNLHSVKGFGIGLAYVKAIIELHQGNIELESEKGKGSKFIITLPNV